MKEQILTFLAENCTTGTISGQKRNLEYIDKFILKSIDFHLERYYYSSSESVKRVLSKERMEHM